MSKFAQILQRTQVRRISSTSSLRCCKKFDPLEVQRSRLSSGMTIAVARPQGSQMGACTVVYQAGSRYEADDSLGASHFIRVCSDAAGQGYTSYAKTRVLQQYGAYMTCSSDRQNISFTLRCPPPYFPELKYYLVDTAARHCYNHWEVNERRTQVHDDLTRVSPEQMLVDLIQRASFRGPLSNSVFCVDERVDSISSESISKFVKSNFQSCYCSVGSVGLPFEDVLKLSEKIDSCGTRGPSTARVQHVAPRSTLETHDLGHGSDTWIAIAVPGYGTNDFGNLLKQTIIAEACGTGPMQHGFHEYDRMLQQPLGLMAGTEHFTQYKAFSIGYKDAGLFGFIAKTRASSACRSAYAMTEFLRNLGDLQMHQIVIGQERLKMNALLMNERCDMDSENYALQGANNVTIDNAASLCSMVDGISVSDVTTVANYLAQQVYCLSMAVVGDVGAVPHDKDVIRTCC